MNNIVVIAPKVDTGMVTVKVPPRQVTGRYLAHAKLTPVERAFLAADIVAGRAVVVDLTATQVAMMLRTNATYMAAAAKLDRLERNRVLGGVRPLVSVKPAQPTLPGIVVNDDEALTGIVRRLGVDRALEAIAAVDGERRLSA